VKKLAGKSALVTGGSRGIGKAVAAALAREGAQIMIAARSAAELVRARDDLRAHGAQAFGLAIDVAQTAQVQDLVDETARRFGGIDVLVNAAGVAGPIGPLWQTDPEQWRMALEINLFGTMLTCRAVAPRMIAAGRGKIVNFSGGGAAAPRAGFSAYAAAKAAVVRLTETLAQELRPFNIDVNAIAPGMVNTRMLAAITEAGAPSDEHGRAAEVRKDPPALVAVELPAALAVFLASPQSDGLTGRLISAPHDDWQTWDQARIRELSAQPWLTLRRIDRHTLSPLMAEVAAASSGAPEAKRPDGIKRRL
jgi:NAD(P)-dependent dehydrogenase (short-subunit alcohol dehydrogenase family)